MQHVIEETPEVYYASSPVAVAGDEEIAFLKARSAENPRMRCRLCMHASPASLQHEMLIVHHRSSYVRPHRHATKSETLTVIEGEAIAFTFDDAGQVLGALPLGAPGSGRSFTYLMPGGVWHALVITSEWLVFLETAAGPFDRGATSFPAWAPDGSNDAAVATYVDRLTGGNSGRMKLYERREQCVLCDSRDIVERVPLEPMPIGTPNFNVDDAIAKDAFGKGIPLGIHQCNACGHLQVVFFGNPELQYRDYIYTTTVSLGLAEHFRNYAAEVIATLGLPKGGLVIEFGSNDGTLLRAFKENGMRVQGVDPARAIAATATASGIPTEGEFFTAALARRLAGEIGKAALMVANNVVANVEPMGDLADGVAALLADDGVFVFETQYGADVIEYNLLDTVYHEHISYFLLTPLVGFFKEHGLQLFDVERIATKGGSFRAYVQKANGKREITARLRDLLGREQSEGMFAQPYFDRLTRELAEIRAELRGLVDAARARGEGVAGYGVSVGTTTLLPQFGLTRDIDFLVDDAPGKVAEFMGPDYTIPVVTRAELLEKKPGIVIVFAWRYIDAIAAKNEAYLAAGGTFVVPLPRVRLQGATASGAAR